MKPVYLVIGCPGSGKSWVCDQLTGLYTYVHHDLYVKMTGITYLHAILDAAKTSAKPLLTEAPFSISQTKDPLQEAGLQVFPVFIQEAPTVIAERYFQREKKPIPKGHLTRQQTYAERAQLWGAFSGTSAEVFEHLKKIAAE